MTHCTFDRDNNFCQAGLANEAREPSATPISSHAFSFESRKLDIKDVRRLIYEEILEFHPLEKDKYHEQRQAEQAAAYHSQMGRVGSGVGSAALPYEYQHMVR